jgi:tyrosine-protein kinase Etk/Wzc
MQDKNVTNSLNAVEDTGSQVNFKEILLNYLTYWKWIVASVIVCVSLAFVYLRYAVPQYSINTTLLLKDDKKGGMQSELNAFADLGLAQVKSNVDNEIEILHTRTLIRNTVKELGLNITYHMPGTIQSIEAYKTSPLKITFLNTDEKFYEKSFSFVVKTTSASQYDMVVIN